MWKSYIQKFSTNELNIDFKQDMNCVTFLQKVTNENSIKRKHLKTKWNGIDAEMPKKNYKQLFLQISSWEFSPQNRHIKI